MFDVWFGWECVVFVAFVCVTTCAPLWGGARRGGGGGGGGGGAAGGGGQDSLTRQYVFAASGVSVLAMILSVARGTLGVRSFLGFPSELVYYGAAMWETLYGLMLAFPVVCFLFLPVYYPLGVVSVYQYLELRFRSATVRRLAAATFVWRQLLNLAVTLYTPSVALHAVLGLPHWASALAITALGGFFTVLGGLSAAIRADVIQALTMVGLSVALLARGTVLAGGVGAVVADNLHGGRLGFFNFTWDPRTRVDTLSALVGQLFMSVSVYGCQQTFVQRYCSMPSEARVRKTLMLTVPVVGVMFSLSWVVGMALYAVYRHCDPLAAGAIAAMDEVLPHYVQQYFAWLPGLLGLFLGSLFNGALSFLVSNVNSLATVTWEDFVSAAPAFKDVTDRQRLNIIKTIGIIYGVLIMFLSLGVGYVGGVVEGSQLVTSATSGPLLGVFLLATLLPSANGKGAVAGMVAAHVLTTWMAVGHMLHSRTAADTHMLPLLTDGCDNSTAATSRASPPALAGHTPSWHTALNYTIHQVQLLMPARDDTVAAATEAPAPLLYATSYMWYAAVGTCVCVCVGLAVSALTAGPGDVYSARLLHPLALRASRALPGRARVYTALDDVCPPPAPPPAPAPPPPPHAAPAPAPAPPPPPATAPAFAASASRLFDAYIPRRAPPQPAFTKL